MHDVHIGFGMNGSHGNLIEDLQEYRVSQLYLKKKNSRDSRTLLYCFMLMSLAATPTPPPPHPQTMQGQSWSIGGDPDAQTVATFLRFYTPNIVGASLGKHFFEVR